MRRAWPAIAIGYLVPSLVFAVYGAIHAGPSWSILRTIPWMLIGSPIGWAIGLVSETWPGTGSQLWLALALVVVIALVWRGRTTQDIWARRSFFAVGAALFNVAGMFGFGPA